MKLVWAVSTKLGEADMNYWNLKNLEEYSICLEQYEYLQ